MSEQLRNNQRNNFHMHPSIEHKELSREIIEERKAKLRTPRFIDLSSDLRLKIAAYAFAGALFLGGIYYLQNQIRKHGEILFENYVNRIYQYQDNP